MLLSEHLKRLLTLGGALLLGACAANGSTNGSGPPPATGATGTTTTQPTGQPQPTTQPDATSPTAASTTTAAPPTSAPLTTTSGPTATTRPGVPPPGWEQIRLENGETLNVAPPPDDPVLPEAVTSAAAPAVLRVAGEGCGGMLHGTGFVVSEHLVVTVAHVLAGATSVALLDQNDRTLAATRPDLIGGLARPQQLEVVAFDPTADLALLAVRGDALGRITPLKLGTGEEHVDATSAGGAPNGTVRPPEPTFAGVLGYPTTEIGSAGNLQVAPAQLVASTQVTVADIFGEPGPLRRVWLMAADVRGGMSGGPVVDQQGTVLGVAYSTLTSGPASDGESVYLGTSFAFSVADVQQLIDDLGEPESAAPVDLGDCI